jgi:hypothetical protein
LSVPSTTRDWYSPVARLPFIHLQVTPNPIQSLLHQHLPPSSPLFPFSQIHPSLIHLLPSSSKATHTQKTQQRPGATPSVTRKCNLISSPRRFHPLAHQQAGPEEVGNGQHVGFFFQKKKVSCVAAVSKVARGKVVMAALSRGSYGIRVVVVKRTCRCKFYGSLSFRWGRQAQHGFERQSG